MFPIEVSVEVTQFKAPTTIVDDDFITHETWKFNGFVKIALSYLLQDILGSLLQLFSDLALLPPYPTTLGPGFSPRTCPKVVSISEMIAVISFQLMIKVEIRLSNFQTADLSFCVLMLTFMFFC